MISELCLKYKYTEGAHLKNFIRVEIHHYRASKSENGPGPKPVPSIHALSV